jgi:predicted nucleotidyltransferase
MHIEAFLFAFEPWARAETDIEGVGLVGSHARGTATEESDVDLLILTRKRERYFLDQTWVSLFGEIERSQVEDWGKVESLRIHYRNGLEVECGFATPEWARSPIDEGTLRVVSAGMKILYDPNGLLSRVQRQTKQEAC